MKFDNETADWLDSMAAWWLRELGPIGETLVLPIDEHFRSPSPEALFEAVVGFADMGNWQFELVDETDAVIGDPLANVPRPGMPVPMFEEVVNDEPIPDDGPYPIAYSREQDALGLIAGFARDVSHYLVFTASEEPPGDEDERQAFVETGALLMGFGVFLANCAVRFRQIDTGGLHSWSTSTQGVLRQPDLSYLLALFVELRGGDDKLVLAHLAANPKAAFKTARDLLRGPRHAVVEELRQIVRVTPHDGPYR